MAAETTSMTRSTSMSSSMSSNIAVGGAEDASSDRLASDRAASGTPPTSLAEDTVMGSSKAASIGDAAAEERRRPKRARASVATYDLKKLSAAQQTATEEAGTWAGSRNVSGLTGQTLVNNGAETPEETVLGTQLDDAQINAERELPRPSAKKRSSAKVQRRPSVKDRVKKAASSMAEKVGSVLGKRSREAEAPKRCKEVQAEDRRKSKMLKELDTGPKGVLDEFDVDEFEAALAEEDQSEEDVQPLPAKKPKMTRMTTEEEIAGSAGMPTLSNKPKAVKRRKLWQNQGLYCGQNEYGANPELSSTGARLKKTQAPSSSSSATPSTSTAEQKKKPFMPLPMFTFLTNERPFVIPYDVFAPSYQVRGEEKAKWKSLTKNRWIDDAKELWRTEKLGRSVCPCRPPTGMDTVGCDEDCLNRVMGYECDDSNCALDKVDCGNRAFAELGARVQKGNGFDIGVEVVKTENRGFGIRASRCFAPNQIIMEYSGEVITQEECSKRMHNDYKDKNCYYLMDFEQGMIIDATRGSIARFVNHSCEPNCRMRKIRVGPISRMALFANEAGVGTGEELTYDYNFDNFGETKQKCYCGAAGCRGILGPKEKDADRKKREKREREEKIGLMKSLKRKAGEMLGAVTGGATNRDDDVDKASQPQKKQKTGWVGWARVVDIKEDLIAEKARKEEAAKNDIRALRLARREALARGEKVPALPPRAAVPAPSKLSRPDSSASAAGPRKLVKRKDSKRRSTASATLEKTTVRKVSAQSKAETLGSVSTLPLLAHDEQPGPCDLLQEENIDIAITVSTTIVDVTDTAPTATKEVHAHTRTASRTSHRPSKFTEALSSPAANRRSSSSSITINPSTSLHAAHEPSAPGEAHAAPKAPRKKLLTLQRNANSTVESAREAVKSFSKAVGVGSLKQSTLTFPKRRGRE